MADLQELMRAVDALSASELKLLYKHIVETRIQFIDSQQTIHPARRILGLFEHVGETWTSDDFDAELSDSFWLGEDE